MAGPKCRYPLHVDLSASGSETSAVKPWHVDGCIDEDAKWMILQQDADHVLLAQVRSSTGMPRLALAFTDATFNHLELACEELIERDKEKICATGAPNRTVKFKVRAK